MPFLKWLFVIEEGQQYPSTFGNPLALMSWGSHSILVEKSSLALKCWILKVTLPHFSTISLHKMSKKEVLQLSSSGISKPVKIFLPKLNENLLTSMLMSDQKLMSVATLLQL